MNLNVLYVTFLYFVKVKSNDLILGTISPKSRLLLSDVQHALMAPWVRTRQLTIHGHSDEVICAVRIYDLKSKKDGVVRLDAGEIGEQKIVIGLRSGGPFKGYAFKIEVYVERSQSIPDLDSNTALKDFVRNITKSTLLEALKEIIYMDEKQEEEAGEAKPVTTKKPQVVKKKRKRKKGKKVNVIRKTNESKDKPKKYIHPLNFKVEPLIAEKTVSPENSMVSDESQSMPTLSGIYSRYTHKLVLPTVRISNDIIIKNVPTPYLMSDSTTDNFDPTVVDIN